MNPRYLARRFGQLLLVIWLAATINFLVPHLMPGDPVQTALESKLISEGATNGNVGTGEIVKAFQEQFGTNRPIYAQYYSYMSGLLRGDLGVSISSYPERVSTIIRAALPWTLGLILVSTLIAFGLGSFLGTVLAWPGAPKLFRALSPALLVLSVIPYFLLALVLVYLLANLWPVLPPTGGFEATRILAFNLGSVADVLKHALLPGLSIVIGSLGFWAIGMRGTTISILGEDYIVFAEAKGLSPRRILLHYGMRNAILPQITILGIALGSVFSGAILVEVIFNYPGLGRILYQAINTKDYFVIEGVVLMLVVALATTLFLVDLIYPLLDPRIRYERR